MYWWLFQLTYFPIKSCLPNIYLCLLSELLGLTKTLTSLLPSDKKLPQWRNSKLEGVATLVTDPLRDNFTSVWNSPKPLTLDWHNFLLSYHAISKSILILKVPKRMNSCKSLSLIAGTVKVCQYFKDFWTNWSHWCL